MMKKALGKGLSALIPDSYVSQLKKETVIKPEDAAKPAMRSESGFQMIPITSIRANIDQPRKTFSPEGIEELAASIKEKGILQPVIVKKMQGGDFQLICGERRLRAALLCGLIEVPAVVKDIAPDDFLEWAIIENIQREDLNPIEEAQAYQRLSDERMLSQEEIAKRVGKNRVTITNILRLLRLPQDILQIIERGELSSGHARALLGLPTPEHQRQLTKRIVQEHLSVRQVESIVGRSNAHRRSAKKARHLKPEVMDLERRLSQYLGTQVKIYPRKDQKAGRLEVHYFSLDDLDRILEAIHLPKM